MGINSAEQIEKPQCNDFNSCVSHVMIIGVCPLKEMMVVESQKSEICMNVPS
jgi:hypothetical protein